MSILVPLLRMRFGSGHSNILILNFKKSRSDCFAIYETKNKRLKTLLGSVSMINLTTDMCKLSHQEVEYFVITRHFIDNKWNLQKCFVKVHGHGRGN